MPPGFSPVGNQQHTPRRGSICGSNVPLITELGEFEQLFFLPIDFLLKLKLCHLGKNLKLLILSEVLKQDVSTIKIINDF